MKKVSFALVLVMFLFACATSEKYDRKQLRSEVGLVFQYPEHQLFESDVI